MIEKVGIKCCGCSACASVCPKNCISMKENTEGFLYPQVNSQLCIQCGACEKACPILRVPDTEDNTYRVAWGATCKDREILFSSSSGGLFTLLSQQVLAQGGCVFGAAFVDNFRKVEHIMVTEQDELSKLQGSKYVQSDIKSCYRQAKQELLSERIVLFSGTPCQIAGLRGYLGKTYENLICVDVICHGVPSPLIWKTYLSNTEECLAGKTAFVSFRYKKNDRRKIDFRLKKDKQYFRDHYSDPYWQMFLKNNCLRESCYQCSMKGNSHVSDITVGDFWGVDKVSPELSNGDGVSLILLHTEKGQKLFQRTIPEFNGGMTDYDKAVKGNFSYDHSVRRPAERDSFYADLSRIKWEAFKKKYGRDPWKIRAKRKLSDSIIGRLRRRLLHIGSAEKKTTNYGMLISVDANVSPNNFYL